MTRLYLVRHGVHDLVGKVLAGRMNGVHLGAEGREQAKTLARYFSGVPIATVWSSPLDRCLETAAPIADRLRLPVRAVDAVNEIDCGEWTGRSFDLLRDDPRWIAWNHERGASGVPGGETALAVQARAMGLMERLAACGEGPAIVVTHSDVIKIAVATILGSPLDWHDRLTIDPASITTADLWLGGGKIVRLNEVVAS